MSGAIQLTPEQLAGAKVVQPAPAVGPGTKISAPIQLSPKELEGATVVSAPQAPPQPAPPPQQAQPPAQPAPQTPPADPTAEPGPWKSLASDVARPVLEAGGAVAGSMAGAPGGLAGSLPGGVLGYGAGRELANLLDQKMGLKTPPKTFSEVAQSVMDSVKGGMENEVAGSALGHLLGFASKAATPFARMAIKEITPAIQNVKKSLDVLGMPRLAHEVLPPGDGSKLTNVMRTAVENPYGNAYLSPVAEAQLNRMDDLKTMLTDGRPGETAARNQLEKALTEKARTLPGNALPDKPAVPEQAPTPTPAPAEAKVPLPPPVDVNKELAGILGTSPLSKVPTDVEAGQALRQKIEAERESQRETLKQELENIGNKSEGQTVNLSKHAGEVLDETGDVLKNVDPSVKVTLAKPMRALEAMSANRDAVPAKLLFHQILPAFNEIQRNLYKSQSTVVAAAHFAELNRKFGDAVESAMAENPGLAKPIEDYKQWKNAYKMYIHGTDPAFRDAGLGHYQWRKDLENPAVEDLWNKRFANNPGEGRNTVGLLSPNDSNQLIHAAMVQKTADGKPLNDTERRWVNSILHDHPKADQIKDLLARRELSLTGPRAPVPQPKPPKAQASSKPEVKPGWDANPAAIKGRDVHGLSDAHQALSRLVREHKVDLNAPLSGEQAVLLGKIFHDKPEIKDAILSHQIHQIMKPEASGRIAPSQVAKRIREMGDLSEWEKSIGTDKTKGLFKVLEHMKALRGLEFASGKAMEKPISTHAGNRSLWEVHSRYNVLRNSGASLSAVAGVASHHPVLGLAGALGALGAQPAYMKVLSTKAVQDMLESGKTRDVSGLQAILQHSTLPLASALHKALQ